MGYKRKSETPFGVQSMFRAEPFQECQFVPSVDMTGASLLDLSLLSFLFSDFKRSCTQTSRQFRFRHSNELD